MYVKLVEEMNKIVNLLMEGHEMKDKEPTCSAADLYCFAVESLEQDNVTKAEEYFMKVSILLASNVRLSISGDILRTRMKFRAWINARYQVA